MRVHGLTAAATLVLLSACAGAAVSPTAGDRPTGAPAASPSDNPESGAGMDSDGLGPPAVGDAVDPAVAAARAAMARDLGIRPDSIDIVAVEAVTWPNSALGCERAGELYLQVLTPGYRVTLQADDRSATYHTDRGEGREPRVVRCDTAKIVEPFERLPAIDLGETSAAALDRARVDLESRLGPSTEIELDSTGVANVGALACDDGPTPAPGALRPVILEIRLRAAGAVHLYRARGDSVLYCGIVDGIVTE